MHIVHILQLTKTMHDKIDMHEATKPVATKLYFINQLTTVTLDQFKLS